MSINNTDFEYISRLARDRAAIVLEPGKEYLVDARLSPLARDEGYQSLEDFIGAMRSTATGRLHTKVVEALLTHETSFFRDLYPFEALRTLILPEVRKKLIPGRRLTIWSAASSSGQEAYSIAMLLSEHFPDLIASGAGILATDLSDPMVQRTREGRYNQLEINRGLPANLMLKYFIRQGLEWQVREELRKMIDARPFNLINEWVGLPLVDVVFIRNVLIYFNTETKKKILGRLRAQLRPGGFLVMGAAETTMNLDDSWVRVPFEKASLYRVG